jgi:hypothetical protein
MSDQEQEQEQEPRWDARGMVEAFVNHVRSPKRGHGGSLALAAVLALVVASGAAFAFGMFTRTHDAGRTGDAQTASSDPPLRVTAADRFVALTGYGCPTSSQAGFSLQGTYSDGIDGFVPVAAGGWTKNGCRGRFEAIPMSGSATKPDPQNYAQWTFRTGSIMQGRCRVAVYVPDDKSIEHVGGAPAWYQVYDSAGVSGPPVGSFKVNEPAARGSWVSAGSFPVSNGLFTVELESTGQDWHGNVVTYAHVAAAQLEVACAS